MVIEVPNIEWGEFLCRRDDIFHYQQLGVMVWQSIYKKFVI